MSQLPHYETHVHASTSADPSEWYDVLIIGAGHAGIEAAMAAVRLGCRVCVLTQNLDTIGQMSCNPAIGGLAKGHLVREIDALGGFMGLNTDATGIQFRMLNASKGPSVRAARAQCDKKAYQFRAKYVLESEKNITLLQANVLRLLVTENCVEGVETTMGQRLRSKSVVVTTGTFMRGLLHVGTQKQSGGRMGDSVSTLSDNLKELGFDVRRLKTGTPCRLHGRTVDWSKCAEQRGDDPPPRFSFRQLPEESERAPFTLNRMEDGMFHVEQICCWITHTTEATHEIIRGNLHKSAMFSGQIEGIGPRYCPSIEDKVVRFAEKSQHQLFLEPEGHQTHEIYVNGVSTSLPFEVQLAFIRTIPGLERAQILRAGYAVEYDYCPSLQLERTLETKAIRNLFFAGQINGTSGYEEAGAQGLVAGANAALQLQGKRPLIFGREDAYIGVLIDDLVTKEIFEPYRMFTSRAEHRLLLREGNADLRLTPMAASVGLVDSRFAAQTESKQQQVDRLLSNTASWNYDGVKLSQWLCRPENSWRSLPVDLRSSASEIVWELVQTELRYAGYIQRERQTLERMKRLDASPIPANLDYQRLTGLRNEAREKLSVTRPQTLRQAGRIAGVTPADLAVLAVAVKRWNLRDASVS